MILFEEEGNFQAGALILVDKPLTWTSFDVVNKIRWCLKRTCGKIKVGHAGTLDPLATGLVIVCTGKWTKRIDSFMGQEKEYVASIRFGATTPTFDLESDVDKEYPYEQITREVLDGVLNRFIGNIQQVPPAFSAVRIDGERAYKLARRGTEIEMVPRDIYIRELEVVRFELPELELRVKCGKGTYIRSLANDIGVECGSGAYLSGLCRTMIGDYRVEDANKMENLVAYLQDIS